MPARSVWRNEFKSTGGRLAANAANAGLRTLLLAFIFASIRYLINFEVAKATQLGRHESTLSNAAIAMIIIAPMMNVLGGLMSGIRGTANIFSLASRAALLLLNLGLLAYCISLGAAPALGRLLLTYFSFNALRDLAQLSHSYRKQYQVHPGRSCDSISGPVYSIFNFFGTIAGSLAAPSSGSGALPHAIGNLTVPFNRRR